MPISCIANRKVKKAYIHCTKYYCTLYNSDSGLERLIKSNPSTSDMLNRVGKCALCDGPFVHSWLDCVEFVNSRKVELKSSQNV